MNDGASTTNARQIVLGEIRDTPRISAMLEAEDLSHPPPSSCTRSCKIKKLFGGPANMR